MEKELKTFIKDRTAVDAQLDSILFDDIGLSGLDADTFMMDFFEEFKVDNTGFEIDKYRVPENRIASIFLQLWKVAFNRKESGLDSFSFQHLLDVIEKGKWFDPPTAASL